MLNDILWSSNLAAALVAGFLPIRPLGITNSTFVLIVYSSNHGSRKCLVQQTENIWKRIARMQSMRTCCRSHTQIRVECMSTMFPRILERYRFRKSMCFVFFLDSTSCLYHSSDKAALKFIDCDNKEEILSKIKLCRCMERRILGGSAQLGRKSCRPGAALTTRNMLQAFYFTDPRSISQK